MKCTIC